MNAAHRTAAVASHPGTGMSDPLPRPQHALTALRRLASNIPEGRGLDSSMWQRRHTVVVAVLWLHVGGLALFAMARGYGVAHSALEASSLAVFGLVATQARGGRRFRSAVAACGLMLSSALLVHLWDGVTEAHFHFFVMVALLSVYQDWVPFLMALGFVVLHHGAVGVLAPRAVYDHTDAVDHPWVWALIHGAFVLAAAAANTYGWLTSEDDHRRAVDAARRSEEAFRALFERNPQPMWVFDVTTGEIIDINSAAVSYYGFSRDEFLNRRVNEILDPQDLAELVRVGGSQHSGRDSRVWVQQTKSGRAVKVVGHAERLTFQGRDARVVVIFDMTDRISLEDELRHQAFHDALTGLGNRELFRDRLDHALARRRRGGGPLAVMTIDLDDFKAVNDAHGHLAGDRLLVEVGARLREELRPEDTVARMGGDEFALLVEGVSTGDLIRLANRLLRSLQQPVAVGDTSVRTTASIGVAIDRGKASDGASIMRNADVAMYEAKFGGKGRCEVFRPGMRSRVLQRTEIAAELRDALERDELYLEYQPIVDLATGHIGSVEALLRWRHPERGIVGPVEFIPIAEETGIIVDIGAWVLRTACAQLSAWIASGTCDPAMCVSVNVSPRQLRESDFISVVTGTLGETGVPPAQLTLEVTEGAMVEDMVQARGSLAGLRGAGVRIAVDDFGTGYSSIAYLGSLPLDAIKVDRSFVAGLTGKGDGRELVLALVRLVDTLNATTIMEGVETAEERDYVESLGVDGAQGYFFSRPVGPEALAELLATSRRSEDTTAVRELARSRSRV